jgi:hypothetical protein
MNVVFTDTDWWYKEIKRRSRSRFDVLPYFTFAIIIAGILASAYIITFLSEGGKFGSIEISKDVAKWLLFTINFVNGGAGITSAIGILRFRKPPFLRYHKVALTIVDEAYQKGIINNSVKEQMRDAIALHLTPCDDPANKKQCEEELQRLAYKLAALAGGG